MISNKRNLMIVALIVVTVLVVVRFALLLNRDNDSDSQRPPVPTAPVQSEEEIKKVSTSLDDFSAIMVASKGGEHAKAIELAKAYGRNTNNRKTERMNAYILCLDSARETSDSAVKSECQTELEVMVQTLEPEDKELWKKLIEATNQGKALESASQEQQIQ